MDKYQGTRSVDQGYEPDRERPETKRDAWRAPGGRGPLDRDPRAPVRPVRAWLVCVNGPNRGRDYAVTEAITRVGRGLDVDVGEEAGNARVVIARDAQTGAFTVAEENGALLGEPRPLSPYAQISVGRCSLVFVPYI